MDNQTKIAYKGTDLKFILNIEIEGFSMEDDDFKVRLYSHRKSLEIPKKQMKQDEQGRFLFGFHTEDLGVGDIMMETIAYVPDTDFEDGIRKEVDRKILKKVV